MKKRSKLFVLTAAAMLGFGVLTACSTDENGSSAQTSSVQASSVAPVSSGETPVSSASQVKKYTVTFDLNGGTMADGSTTIASQEVEEGHWATKPVQTPVKAHSTFKGWFDSDGFQFNFMTQIYGDVALHAEWTVNEESKVTLTFDPNNGEANFTVETFLGDVISVKVPSKEGYAFMGWYLDGDESKRFTGSVNSDVAACTKLIALYAKQNFNYRFEMNDDGTLTITGIVDLNSVSLQIPSTIDGRTVTGIGEKAFQSRVYVQEITLPATITSIHPQCFNGARALTTITVESGNTKYKSEDGVLYNYDFTELLRVPPKGHTGKFYVKSGVKKIGAYCFYDHRDEGVTEIDFGSTLEEIGDKACYGINFQSLVFPASLKKIGEAAFEVFTSSSNQTTITWSEGLEEIGNGAFEGQYIKGNLVLPSTVKIIRAYAFGTPASMACAIENVALPASLELLEPGAFFNGYGIQKISLAASNASYVVENNILYSKDKKTVVFVPGNWATTGGETIRFASGVSEIGDFACDAVRFITNWDLPSTLRRIGKKAFFYNVSVSSMAIPEGVSEIGESAFDSSSLRSITLPSTLLTVGKYAFADTKLSSIVIPGSLKKVANSCFFGTPLTSITFEEGVEEIGDAAFNYAPASNYDDETPTSLTSDLKSVVFPASLKKIGSGAFANQSALTSVTFGANIEEVGGLAFSSSPITTLKVTGTGGAVAKDLVLYTAGYKKALFASTAKNGELNLPEGVEEVSDYAFSHVKADLITLPNTLKVIGEGAFESTINTTSLDDRPLEIPSSVTDIGEGAFYWCNFTSLTLHEGLKNIGPDAFAGTKVVNLTLPSTVENVGLEAFANASLKTLSLNEGLKTIGDYAFWGNYSLGGEITIPASLESLGQAPFAAYVRINVGNEITNFKIADGSTHFSVKDGVIYDKAETHVYAIAGHIGQGESKTIVLPSTVTSIGEYGLAGAAFLKGITLPEGLTFADDQSFAGDKSVTVLTLPKSLASTGVRLFEGWVDGQIVKVQHTEDWTVKNYNSDWKGTTRNIFSYAAQD